MNENMKQGLELIKEGIDILLSEGVTIEEPITETKATKATKAPGRAKAAAVVSKAKKEEPAEEIDGEVITEEYLASPEFKPFSALKSLAAQKGVSAKGTRNDIVERLLGLPISGNAEPEPQQSPEEVVEKATPVKSTPKKPGMKKAAPAPAEPEPVDEVTEKINILVADMEDEELKVLLKKSKLSISGKRQALIDRIIDGVKTGAINLVEDDTEEEESKEGITVEAVWEIIESLDEEGTAINDRTNPGMTDERRNAIEEYAASVVDSVNSGETTQEEMNTYISAVFNTEFEDYVKYYASDDIATTTAVYLDVIMKMIDDAGDVLENASDPEGCYILNNATDEGIAMHCGFPMSYIEDTNAWVCEACGASFE